MCLQDLDSAAAHFTWLLSLAFKMLFELFISQLLLPSLNLFIPLDKVLSRPFNCLTALEYRRLEGAASILKNELMSLCH